MPYVCAVSKIIVFQQMSSSNINHYEKAASVENGLRVLVVVSGKM